jgi:L-alanine-DL-glutamate epimerase-like enolase superfamily enzyme
MLSPALFASPLRAELTRPEVEVHEGSVALPTAPGLGIELVENALETYRV